MGSTKAESISTSRKWLLLMVPNVNEYMVSDNPALRSQYQMIRQSLAGALRELFSMPESHNPQVRRDRLLKLRQSVEARDVLMDGTVDYLVREHAISSQMATSLMNDSAFALQIVQALVETAEQMMYAAYLVDPHPTESS